MSELERLKAQVASHRYTYAVLFVASIVMILLHSNKFLWGFTLAGGMLFRLYVLEPAQERYQRELLRSRTDP